MQRHPRAAGKTQNARIPLAYPGEMGYHTSMAAKLPNLFEYNSFRRYLADYQRARQKGEPHFTRSFICRSLGLPRTRSYFSDVLNGKEVSKTFVERFIKLLQLNKIEAQFFRVLVQFNQAETSDEREFQFQQLISLNRTPTRTMDPASYLYYQEWYHGAIRALLEVYDFTDDYAALARTLFPSVSTRKVRESIALLTRLGLVAPNEQGFLKPTEKSISTGPVDDGELIKQYQMQTIDLAKSVLLQRCRRPHLLTTNVVSVSEEGYRRLQRHLTTFRAQTRSLVHKDENRADRVYYLNIQLFPISQ